MTKQKARRRLAVAIRKATGIKLPVAGSLARMLVRGGSSDAKDILELAVYNEIPGAHSVIGLASGAPLRWEPGIKGPRGAVSYREVAGALASLGL